LLVVTRPIAKVVARVPKTVQGYIEEIGCGGIMFEMRVYRSFCFGSGGSIGRIRTVLVELVFVFFLRYEVLQGIGVDGRHARGDLRCVRGRNI
jgi:hypothetical protein